MKRHFYYLVGIISITCLIIAVLVNLNEINLILSTFKRIIHNQTMMTASGTIIAALIALVPFAYQYGKSVNIRRSEWIHTMFEQFYIKPEFKEARKNADSPKGRKTLEVILKKDESVLNVEERDQLDQFTDYLNFFEFMMFLKNKKQLKNDEIEFMFHYYLKTLLLIEGIINYLGKTDYQHLKEYLTKLKHDTDNNAVKLFVYGTLLQKYPNRPQLSFLNKIHYTMDAKIIGTLYNMGEYPGAKESKDGFIFGEVYDVDDENVFDLIDQYEEFDPTNSSKSLFVRKKTFAITYDGKNIPVFTYFYNKAPNSDVISSGNWLEFAKNKES